MGDKQVVKTTQGQALFAVIATVVIGVLLLVDSLHFGVATVTWSESKGD